LFLVCAVTLALAQTGDTLFGQARAAELAGEVLGAMTLYERIVRDFPSNRPLVARALFQLGELNERLNEPVRSREYFQRLIKDYADTDAGTRAKTRLAAAGVTRVEIKTPYSDDPYNFALAPDGRSIVYQATVGGKAQLWLHSLDTGNAAPLPGTDGAKTWTLPFWSPDGKSVGFFADGKLKRVDIAGGNAKELADAPWPYGGTWSSDGIILFTPFQIGALYTVPTAGGPRTALTPEDDLPRRWPQFLPDGRRFLFAHGTLPTVAGGWQVGRLGSPNEMQLLSVGISAVLFAPPDRVLGLSGLSLVARLIDLQSLTVGPLSYVGGPVANFATAKNAFSASATGLAAFRAGGGIPRTLQRRERQGRVHSSVELPPGTTDEIRLSPDGRYVMLKSGPNDGFYNKPLWLMDLVAGSGRVFETRPIGNSNFFPVWSPDGTQIAKSHGQPPHFNVISQPFNSGGAPTRVLFSPETKWGCDWSVQGFFLYQRVSPGETRADLLAARIQIGDRIVEDKPGAPDSPNASAIPVAVTPAMESCGRFSPDGRWIAFQSNERGRNEIFVQPFSEAPPDPRQRVLIGSGTSPEWRGDGRELFFLSEENRLMAIPVTFSPDGRSIELGKAAALFSAPLPGGTTYAAFKDGQQFLFNTPTGSAAPIVIVPYDPTVPTTPPNR
jgi:Tol biopolymer transport system component